MTKPPGAAGSRGILAGGFAMTALRSFLDSVPWVLAVFLALTLGLAPFRPPHVVEKLQMLAHGTLVRPIDWFDFLLHLAPWLLLILKAVLGTRR
jgi:hypothetical protein